jgi:SPOR domain
MADNYTQRPNRSSQPPLRQAPGTASSTPAGADPLAELARLIGQNDPFSEYGAASQHAGEPTEAYSHSADALGAAPGHGDDRYADAPRAYADERYADSHYPDAQHPAAQVQAPPYGAPDAYAPSYAQLGYGEATYGQVPEAHAQVPEQDGYEQGPYYPNNPNAPVEELDFYDDVPPRRRMGIIALAAVFALAVVGAAGAFGYHALFGASAPSGPPPVIKADATPSKIVPAASHKDAKTGKLIYDRVNNGAQNEKLVSREEQPIDIKDKPIDGVLPQTQQNVAPTGSMQPEALGSGVVGVEPKKVQTIAIHPDQMAAAAPPAAAAPQEAAPAPEPAKPSPPPQAKAEPPPQHRTVARAEPTEHHTVARAEPRPTHHVAERSNAPLSLNPNAPEPPAATTHHVMRTAAVAPPVQIAPGRASAPERTAHSRAPASIAPAAGGHYAVQIVSRHQEADAKSSFHNLQAKYPQQLGGRSPLIRRVDLGAKGVYYRAMVGPFGSAEEAGQLCSHLKAAGAQCLVQKI